MSIHTAIILFLIWVSSPKTGRKTFHFCNHGNIFQRRSYPIFPVGQIIRQVGSSFQFLLEVSSINIELDIAFSAKNVLG